MEEIDEPSADVPGEPTEINSTSAPIEQAEVAPEAAADTTSKWGLNRRKFLTAAALGTAAAALLNKGGGGYLHLGPASALANDLSGNPCTAQDVEIIGTGVVQNEPCSCTGGTFTAHVQFTVRNNTSTGRYCIALHLPGGFGVPAQDVILRDSGGSSTAPGKSGGESFHDTVMFGDITGFPCNTGGTLVCIGQQGVTTGKCAANTCTTIAWNTSPGAATCTTADQKPPGGQCRHQGICIQGFGASLVCKSGCTPSCGGTAVLTASVSGGVAPYTYCLSTDGKTCTTGGTCAQTFGPTSATSHDFSVIVTQDTTYTLTIIDSQPNGGCCRDASTSLSATPVAKPLLSRTGPDCDGNATITVTNCDASLTYTWYDNGVLISGASGCSLTQKFAPGLHSITVTASNGDGTCSATSDANVFTVNQPVTLSLDDFVQTDCTGNGSFTAHASGGAGGYTFTWEIDSSTVSGVTGDTLSYTAKLDGTCHHVTVSVKDSAGCPSTPASVTKSISQCVTTTAC